MTKKAGFLVTLSYFLPIDKKDYAKQAATYQAMAEIEKTGRLPADLISTAILVGVPKVKQGNQDVPDAPAGDQGDKQDPATWPLTADPLPDGAVILESSEALDLSVFQTIRLEDGTETFRRISAEQNAAEVAAAAKAKKK